MIWEYGPHKESFLTSFDVFSWLARVPPPYRLTCDLAVVPVLLPAVDAQALGGISVSSLAGRTLGVLLLARYTAARFCPNATPYPAPPGDFYREVSLALPVSGGPWPAFVFPRMWVDVVDEAPITLGHAYGFPKERASVTWQCDGNELRAGVGINAGEMLTFAVVTGPSISGGWLAPLSGIWAVFPTTGLHAAMRLEHTGKAALLRTRRLVAPPLAAARVSVCPLPGLLLRECVVALGPPLARQ